MIVKTHIKDDLGPEEDVEQSSKSKPHEGRHEESWNIGEKNINFNHYLDILHTHHKEVRQQQQ